MSRPGRRLRVQVQVEETSNVKKQVGKVGGLLLAFFYLILATAGFTLAYLSVFPATFNRGVLILGLLGFCLLATAIYSLPKMVFRMIALAVAFIIYLIVGLTQVDHFQAGAAAIGEGILEKVNLHYDTNYIIQVDNMGDATQQTAFLLVCLFPVVMGLGFGIIRRYQWLVVIAIFSIPVIGAMVVGDFPSLLALALMALSILAATGGKRMQSMDEVGRNTSLTMVAITVVALGIGLASLPLLNNTYEDHKKELDAIKTYVNDDVLSKLERTFITIPFLNSGAVGGDLRSGERTYDGTTQLEVTMAQRPEGAIYFKGFVGSTYTGEEWVAVDGQAFDEYAKARGWGEEDEEIGLEIANLPFNLMEQEAAENDLIGRRELTVERVHASSRYAYLPYWSYVSDDYAVDGDGAIEGIGRRTNEITSLTMNRNTAFEIRVQDEQQNLYKEYVYETYLDYPTDRLVQLADQCKAQGLTGLWEITNYISQTLYATAEYDTHAAAAPQGKDFTEYFLYEQKRGYCIHFASTATLMYRMMGVPARYVTGYVAPTNTFFDNADGTYTSTLKDDMAHAWTEIYTDAGWVPVEMTPPFETGEYVADGARPAEATPEENPADGTSITITPTPTEEDGSGSGGESGDEPGAEEVTVTEVPPEETPEETSEETEKKSTAAKIGGVLVRILIVFAILLVVFFLAILIGGFVKRMIRYSKFRTTNYNENIKHIYKSLYEMLVFDKMDPEVTVTTDEFVPTVLRKYPVISEDEMDQFKNTVLQANFGPKVMTGDDSVRAMTLYRKLRQAILSKCNLRQKINFHIGKGF